MSQIIVSTQELSAKKESLVTLTSSLESQITNLETVGNSLNSMWEGNAKENYTKALREDITKMKNFLKVIKEFITVLQKIITIYETIEKKNVSTAIGGTQRDRM
ncbi:MAG: WXG100 family type VII secretion target [Eubacterium sp.]|nr:WXG100 family type VII secretion target [Eubacterium sp.]MDD7208468.1 WXG100 family type VII secretion target [Lachnospiraceae bacterium]MDY5497591.1 WXG100 family type VII secretion target [Anaerobutyricum sp.]